MASKSKRSIQDRLDKLSAFLEPLEQPGTVFAKWLESQNNGAAANTKEQIEYSKAGFQFFQTALELSRIDCGLEWGKWSASPEGVSLQNDPDALANATLEQLEELLAMIMQGERSAQGALVDAYETGLLAAAHCRVKALSLERAGKSIRGRR